MAMMKCSECGREISDKAKVCPGCGAETDAGRRAEEEKNRIWRSILMRLFVRWL